MASLGQINANFNANIKPFMTSINTVLTGLQKLTTLSKEVQMSMANINIKTPLKHIQDQVHNTTGTIVNDTKEMGKSIAKNLDPGKTKILDTPLKQTKQLNNEVKGVTGNLQDMMKARGRDSVITPRRADAHVIKVPDEDIMKTTAKNVQNMAKEIPHTGIRMFDEKNLEAIKDAPPIDLSKSMVVDYSKDLQKVMKIMDPFDTKKMLPDEKEIKGASKGIAKETEKIAQEPAIRGPVQKTLDDQMIPIKQPVVEHAQEYTKTIQSTLGVQHDLRESTDAVSNSYAMNMKNAIAHGQILDQNVGKGLAVKTMFKTMADGSVQASHRMVDANRNTLASMLSLKNMVGKMVHYITFSIGVQMVMKMREAIVSLITTFRDFERSIVNATTVAGNMGGSFEKVAKRLSDVSLLLGRTTVYSAQEVADAFYDLASAGFDVSKMTENDLLPILNYAAATQTNLKDATYAVSVTLKAFGLDIKDTERVVDTFTATITNSFMTFEKLQEAMRHVAPIAGTLKMELEEVSSALALLTDRGYTGSQAGQRLNMILTRLLQPTEQAEKRLREMGLTLQDIDPEVHSLETILQRLKAANFGAADAAIMFRARTAAAAAVLVDSVESIGKYTMMLKGAGGITEQVAKAQIDTLYGSLKLLRDAFAETGIAMGEKLAPHIRVLADFIQNSFLPVIVKLGDFLQTYWGIISKVITAWIVWKSVLIASQVALGAYNTILAFKIALQKLEISNERILMKVFGKKMAATMILNKQLKAEMVTRTAAIAAQQAQSKATLTQTTLFNFQSIAAKKAAASNIALAGSFKIAAAAGLMLKTVLLPLLLITGAVIGIIAVMNYLNKDFGRTSDVTKKAGMNVQYLASEMSLLEAATYYSLQSNESLAKSIDYLTSTYDYWNDELANNKKEIMGVSKAYSLASAQIAAGAIDIKGISGFFGLIPAITLGRENLYSMGVAMEHLGETAGPVRKIFYGLGSTIFKFLGGLTNEAKKAEIDSASSFKGVADSLGDLSKGFMENISFKGDMLRVTGLLVSRQASLKTSILKLKNAQDDYKKALEAVNHLKKEGITDLKAFTEANDRLIESQNKLDEANQNFTNNIGKTLQRVREYSEHMDDAVGYLEAYYNAQRRIDDFSRAQVTLEQRKADAVAKYAEALSRSGSNSKEAYHAYVDLQQISRDFIDNTESIINATVESENAQARWNMMLSDSGYIINKSYNQLMQMGWTYQELVKATDAETAAQMALNENRDHGYNITIKATKVEMQLMEFTQKLMGVREEYVGLLQKQISLTAQLEAYERLLAEATKIANENLLSYLETQMKIFKIELKLYKLRRDTTKHLNSLFDALADQGLLNDDIIEGYVAIQKAEGAILALNKDYADVLSKLNPEQRGYVDTLLSAEHGSDEYLNALSELQSLVDQGIISQSELNTIIAMDNAQRNLVNVTKEYMDVLGPLMQSMIEQGIVSSEVAEIWNQLISIIYETTEAEINLGLAQDELSDSMNGVIRNVAMLGKALIDSTVIMNSASGILEGQRDLFDEYGSASEHAGKTVMQVLLENIGIWDLMGGSIDSVRQTFEEFYGMNMDQILEEYGQAGFISAAAMIQMGQAAGLWVDGMSEADLALALGIDNLAAFRSVAGAAWSTADSGVGTLADINSTLKETNEILERTFGNIEKILKDMARLQKIDNVFEFSIIWDFAELTDAHKWRGNIESFLSDLDLHEILFTPDLTIEWKDLDWKAFADIMSDSLLADDFKKQLWKNIGGAISGIPENIDTWTWETWKDIFNTEAFSEGILNTFKQFSGQKIDVNVIPQVDDSVWAEAFFSLNQGLQNSLINATSTLPPALVNTILKIEEKFPQLNLAEKFNITPVPRNLEEYELFMKGLGPEERSVFIKGIWSNLDAPMREYIRQFAILMNGDSNNIPENVTRTTTYTLTDHITNALRKIIDLINNIPRSVTTRINTLVEFVGSAGQRFLNWLRGLAEGGIIGLKQGGIIGQPTPFATGGIVGLASGITKTKGPTFAMIGEAGAEAVIPLEGGNKKYGRSILNEIIPKYFPEMTRQMGGISNVDNTRIEEYNILGPVNVTGIGNVQDLAEEFKYKYRSSK
jgi:TP901 family phage tail tape measure protein